MIRMHYEFALDPTPVEENRQTNLAPKASVEPIE
jgi:hypothetical protein